MSRISAVGGEEFVLGFRLAGIRDTKVIGKDPLSEIKSVMQNKEISIVIIDEKIVNSLEFHDKMDIENSIHPVVVQLSTEGSQDSLRKLVKKSIGVDLWDMERG